MWQRGPRPEGQMPRLGNAYVCGTGQEDEALVNAVYLEDGIFPDGGQELKWEVLMAFQRTKWEPDVCRMSPWGSLGRP